MNFTILERPTHLTAKDFKTRLERELAALKGELGASVTVDGFSSTGWVQLHIAGEDGEILSELISRKFRLAQTSQTEINMPGNYPAVIVGAGERGLKVDLGLGPENLECLIQTGNLNAQLADGKRLPLRELIECYCLYPNVKIAMRISRRTEHEVDGWLSDDTINRFADWVETGLDRILAFECFKEDAESAVRRAHLSRDVISVNSLSLNVQSIVCKLGTDAVGLIPLLGRILRKQPLKPFQPKKIISRCRPW